MKKVTVKSLGLLNEKFRLTNSTKDEIVLYILKQNHFEESEVLLDRSVELACQILEVVFPAEQRLKYKKMWEEISPCNLEAFNWRSKVFRKYCNHGSDYNIGSARFISTWKSLRWSSDEESNYYPFSHWSPIVNEKKLPHCMQKAITDLMADRDVYEKRVSATRTEIKKTVFPQTSVLRLCNLVPSMVDVINAIYLEKEETMPPCSDIIEADGACALEGLIKKGGKTD